MGRHAATPEPEPGPRPDPAAEAAREPGPAAEVAGAPERAPSTHVGHGHGHGHDVVLPAGERRRARILLTAIVVPLLLATVAGLLILWPRGETIAGTVSMTAEGTSFERARITAVDLDADPAIRAVLLTGPGTGAEIPVGAPPEVLSQPVPVGATIQVIFDRAGLEDGAPFIFVDYVRDVPLLWLVAVYVVGVAAVARWRGLAAMVGLGASLVIIGTFVLPALMSGTSPLLVALVGSSAMMFLSVYLAHGVSIRTTTALLGTFAGLAVTTLLALWSADATHLIGTGSEEGYTVSGLFPEMSLRAMLVCGFVIAGLGALNDVTITQASAVWELHGADPTAKRRSVFGRAMRIGRDHIASTVYTLAFAYVGTALPMLLAMALFDRSLGALLTSGALAEEIVRTLVSSIGLILAIPITTAIAAALVRTSRS